MAAAAALELAVAPPVAVLEPVAEELAEPVDEGELLAEEEAAAPKAEAFLEPQATERQRVTPARSSGCASTHCRTHSSHWRAGRV